MYGWFSAIFTKQAAFETFSLFVKTPSPNCKRVHYESRVDPWLQGKQKHFASIKTASSIGVSTSLRTHYQFS